MGSSNFGRLRMKIKSDIEKNIKEIVYLNCNFEGKNGFKIKMPLHKLIDQYSPEFDKLRLYVVASDNIASDINAYFPFIDMTGINLQWSTKELIDTVIQLYFSIYTFTMEDLKEKGMIRYDKRNKFIKC